MIQEDLPQEIINQAGAARAQILPEKSRGVYKMYDKYDFKMINIITH